MKVQPSGHAFLLGFSRRNTQNIADNSAAPNPLLCDFYGHQAWADAEHWRAIEAHPPAAEDAPIKNRLHHIHQTLTDARLEERIAIPWFKDPPLSLSVTEALTQCAMHSHYHRAQNATRPRELGGEPPGTDLIIWYWKGRPAPVWT